MGASKAPKWPFVRGRNEWRLRLLGVAETAGFPHNVQPGSNATRWKGVVEGDCGGDRRTLTVTQSRRRCKTPETVQWAARGVGVVGGLVFAGGIFGTN